MFGSKKSVFSKNKLARIRSSEKEIIQFDLCEKIDTFVHIRRIEIFPREENKSIIRFYISHPSDDANGPVVSDTQKDLNRAGYVRHLQRNNITLNWYNNRYSLFDCTLDGAGNEQKEEFDKIINLLRGNSEWPKGIIANAREAIENSKKYSSDVPSCEVKINRLVVQQQQDDADGIIHLIFRTNSRSLSEDLAESHGGFFAVISEELPEAISVKQSDAKDATLYTFSFSEENLSNKLNSIIKIALRRITNFWNVPDKLSDKIQNALSEKPSVEHKNEKTHGIMRR